MTGVPPSEAVLPDEILARFVFLDGWIRADGTVKQNAFIPRPSPHLDLSVVRHTGLESSELWKIGEDIVNSRAPSPQPIMLRGRADVRAGAVLAISDPKSLRLCPTPPPPINHVDILGWPEEKSAQKIIAAQIAAVSKYISKPPQQ
jgi:hypothetical protein